MEIIKKIIVQSNIKNLKQVFEKKAKPVKNLLAGNIDAFGEFLLSIRIGINLSWKSLDILFTEIFDGKTNINLRYDFFNFSDVDVFWFINVTMLDSSFAFSNKVNIPLINSSKPFLHLNGNSLKIQARLWINV